jgi:transcription elongation factor Elf1
MSILLKTANLDLKLFKSVPANLKLRVNCPDCSAEAVHDFNKRPLVTPEQLQLLKINFTCPACSTPFSIPAKIQNIRMVLAYDPEKIER